MLVHEGNGEMAATLVDISRRGMRLQTRTPYPCGGNVHVMPPAHHELAPVQGRIVRIAMRREEDEEVYELAVEFAEETDPARHAWFLALREAA